MKTVFLFILALGLAPFAYAEDGQELSKVVAALPQPSSNAHYSLGSLPQPLDKANLDRYKDIFAFQKRADWRSADAVIGKLTDSRLLGHVMAARYLHSKYRVSYKELKDWLDQYRDLPEASTLYKLALKRKAKNAPFPLEPKTSSFKSGNPDNVGIINDTRWKQGLAAWQKGDYAGAAQNFQQVVDNNQDKNWVVSAGAFWAARAYLKNRQPEKVSSLLHVAADQPRTFYGQVARRSLGMSSAFNWNDQTLTDHERDLLLQTAAGQRAFALIQTGQLAYVEGELHNVQKQADLETTAALAKVAQNLRMTNLSMRVGVKGLAQQEEESSLAGALYPLPKWQPKGGFRIDPALLYAVMRQESVFDPEARSPSGAKGLMQLMPKTAAMVAKRTGHQRNLYDPEVNMALAQDYMDQLLESDQVEGDLLLLAAAYNAGPGKVAEWKEAGIYQSDPLLFIEQIPYGETRVYVQKVLANFWIYQERLGQTPASLDSVLGGGKPDYKQQASTKTSVSVALDK
ncbi:MAG: lytic transglycosylase domain-containing protein [Alphaproteobacteria bacterium]|nr:lytic transglycosylase domain-containing protein [Alphaproteobacteria bacterium]